MRQFLLSLALLAPLFTARVVFAAPSEEPLTLRNALQEALANNPALRASDYETQSAKALVGPAGALEDPVLSLGTLDYPLPSFSPRRFEMTGHELALSQKFPYPGKRASLEQAAHFSYLEKKEEAASARFALVRDVKLSYFDLALAQKKQALLGAKKDILEQSLASARNRLTLSTQSQDEALGLQVELGSLESDLTDNQREIEVALGDLNHILGRTNHDHPLKVDELTPPQSALLGLSEEVLLQKAVENNPRLKVLDAKSGTAGARVDYEKLNKLPDFEVMLAYLQRLPVDGERGDDMVSARISVPLPVWSESKQNQMLAAARLEQKRVGAFVAEEKNHIRHYIHTALAEMQAGRAKVDLLKGALMPLTDQAIESALAAYSTDKASYAVLLALINRRCQAQISYYEALTTQQKALAGLEALIAEGQNRGEEK
jgi:outer membrane protein, heavy metal efflux system